MTDAGERADFSFLSAEFSDRLKAEISEAAEKWKDRNRDELDRIGRVTRSHLLVEHYLSEYIAKRNPKLGSVEKLSFAQLVDLACGPDSLYMNDMLGPALRALNRIRNSLAHELEPNSEKNEKDENKIREFNRWFHKAGLGTEAGPIAEVIEKFSFLTLLCLKLERLLLEEGDKLKAQAEVAGKVGGVLDRLSRAGL